MQVSVNSEKKIEPIKGTIPCYFKSIAKDQSKTIALQNNPMPENPYQNPKKGTILGYFKPIPKVKSISTVPQELHTPENPNVENLNVEKPSVENPNVEFFRV